MFTSLLKKTSSPESSPRGPRGVLLTAAPCRLDRIGER